MDLFITGASGFVGRALCRELEQKGHQLYCLVRPGSEKHLISSPRVHPVCADLFSLEELTAPISKVDAAIHLVGIIRQFPTRQITFERLHQQATTIILEATRQAGVKRFLHMSANGTDEQARSAYHQSKWHAEQAVRKSGLEWTIFRPSLIYGPEDQFINLIANLIRRLPVVPVIGDGEYLLQPVPVEQIAHSFSLALEQSETIEKTYFCGGKDQLSYNQLLDLIGAALGKSKVRKVHQPLLLMQPIVAILQHLPIFPLTSDQLQMLLAGNCCDTTQWLADFHLEPSSTAESLSYLKK